MVKTYKILLILIWLAVQAFFFQELGTKVMHDSYRYVQGAEYILDNDALPAGHNLRYVGYSGFLAIILGLGGSLTTAVFCQIIISGFACLAQYRLAQKVLRSEVAALISVSCLVLFPEIVQWNMYILTESLFISTAVLALYFLLHLRLWWHYLFYLLLLLFICLLRPNGFIMAMAAFVYLFVQIWQQQAAYRKVLLISSFILTGVFLIVLNSYLLTTFRIVEVYQRGDIIFGYYNLLVKPEFVPDLSRQPTSPFIKIIKFLVYNPGYFFKAGFLKVFYFFSHVKPYYSFVHTLFTVSYLYPLYFLAVWARHLNQAVFAFIICAIALQALMVFFTTEDWDGRFLMPVLPFIFLLSASGVANLFPSVMKQNDGETTL